MGLQYKKPAGVEFKLQIPNPLKDQLLNLSRDLSTPPNILTRILEVTSNLNSDVDHIVDVMSTQPVLVAKILKAANSAFYGLFQTVSSVNQAVLFLGALTEARSSSTRLPTYRRGRRQLFCGRTDASQLEWSVTGFHP